MFILDNDQFTTAELKDIVLDMIYRAGPEYNRLKSYYKGENQRIVNRRVSDSINPHANTPVPLGRKIINTIQGYMYRPGNIRYYSDDESLSAYMEQVGAINREALNTAKAGKDTAVYGEAFELLWYEKFYGVRWAPVAPQSMRVYYGSEIDPGIKAAVYLIKRGDKAFTVSVYYQMAVVFYDVKIDSDQVTISEPKSEVNVFSPMVPVVHYVNNDEGLGDIEPVIPLIDAHDVLVSDSLNEFDRFAASYLIIAKMAIEKRDLVDIKTRRVFDKLASPDQIKFLTKDIPTAFIDSMRSDLRKLVHMTSQVPDFTDERFSREMSGIAMKRALWDFEFLCSTKQAYFEQGLRNRLELVQHIERKAGSWTYPPVGTIKIEFVRNIEDSIREAADTAAIMLASTSRETALKVYPKTLIPDIQEELQKIEAEKNVYTQSLTEAGKTGMDEEQPATNSEDDDGEGRPGINR